MSSIFKTALLSFAYSILGLSLLSCGTMNNVPKFHMPKSSSTNDQNIAVFIDGTRSNAKSNSNVLKLRNLMSLRSDPDFKSIYIKGVGTEYRIIGAMTGWGIGNDVRWAYKFLAEQYDPSRNDKIFLFGFSRGAYTNRILTGLIRSVGLPKFDSTVTDSEKRRYIRKLYRSHKGKFDSFEERKRTAENAIDPNTPHSYPKIEFMGLWDTVEALGLPNGKEDFIYPNARYDDKLEIVKRVAHAMSLNDERAYLFTPILMTNARLLETTEEEAKEIIATKVNEVWFSGAHSDVGGTYENTFSDNYSLQWMLNQLEGYNILPNKPNVFASFQEKLHSGREGIYTYITRKRNRRIDTYRKITDYNRGKLKVHYSVFDRLKNGLDPYEIGLLTIYAECFDEKEEGKYIYVGNDNCCCLEEVGKKESEK